MVFIAPSSPVSTYSDTDGGGKIGFCGFFPRMGFAGAFSPASTDSDAGGRGTASTRSLGARADQAGSFLNTRNSAATKLVFKLDLDSDKRKVMRALAACPGVASVELNAKSRTCVVVGCSIDPIQMVYILRKKVRFAEIMSIGFATRNDTLPRTVRITELLEQSENQQEDQTPPRQTDSLISQVEALPVSHPLPPPLSLPLASEARPSSSPLSHPSRGSSNQTQAAANHAPELSFPFSPSSSHTFRTQILADSPAQSSICRGACLPNAKDLMEEKGLGGHDQLYDSAVCPHLSDIDAMAELKRHYDFHAGEQASQLREAAMLREQVEELEAKVSMANRLERCLRDMLSVSEDRHAGTKRELALMQEKLDEANRRIQYLENDRAEKARRASVEGEAKVAPRPSPVAPRSTPLSFVPSPSSHLTDLEGGKDSALFPELTSYLDK